MTPLSPPSSMTPAAIAEIRALMKEVSDPISHSTERAHARNKIIAVVPALLQAAEQNVRLRNAAQLVWDTVPSQFTGPGMVAHSKALNALGDILRDNIAKELSHD